MVTPKCSSKAIKGKDDKIRRIEEAFAILGIALKETLKKLLATNSIKRGTNNYSSI